MYLTSVTLLTFSITFATSDITKSKSCQVPTLDHGSLDKKLENKEKYPTNETIQVQCKEHYIFPDRTITKDFTCQHGIWVPGMEDCYEFCHPYCLIGKCEKSGIGRCDEGKCQEKAVYNSTTKTCAFVNNFPTTKILVGGLLGGHLLGIIISFVAVTIYARRRKPKKYYSITAK